MREPTGTAACVFDEAVQRMRIVAKDPQSEEVDIRHAQGRTLCADARAQVPLPPFPRAMMDGYAIRWQDLQGAGQTFRVTGTTFAGDETSLVVGQGQAVRIMTGAQIPSGADTVIRFEWCTNLPSDEIRVLRTAALGESVQLPGDDGTAGQILLTKGRTVTPMDAAVCQSFGISTLAVTKPPKIAIIITGSELVEDPRSPLRPGQVYSSNGTWLSGAVVTDGGEVVHMEHVPDDPAEIMASIGRARALADCILMTGGVSAGDHDHVPSVVRSLGATIHIESILMRPGSPFLLAELNGIPLIGLSGSPAAAFVQFESLVRPVLRTSLGMTDHPFPFTGKMLHDIHLKPIKHTRILRARAKIVDGEVGIDAQMPQSSGMMANLATANCLVRIDHSDALSGSIVPLRWIRPLDMAR